MTSSTRSVSAVPDPLVVDRPTHGPQWRSRTELDLVGQQLHAIDRFNRARRLREEAAAALARSREMRMDAARSLEVLRREHDAVVQRAHQHLRDTGDLLRGAAERRVVLAHRNTWFAGKVAQVLQDNGLRLVGQVDNGADAIGLVVAEQPDLLLVEDTLAMVPGEEVVRDVRQFSPLTVVTAHVAGADRVGVLMDAGATTVFTRSMPPADVARQLLSLVGAGRPA